MLADQARRDDATTYLHMYNIYTICMYRIIIQYVCHNYIYIYIYMNYEWQLLHISLSLYIYILFRAIIIMYV